MIYKNISLSEGNTKMGDNMPGVAMTPCASCSKKAPCRKWGKCYVKPYYKQYKQTRKAYDKNFKLAKNDPNTYFSDISSFQHEKKPEFFRWQVSGDILNQNYFTSMKDVSRKNTNTRQLAFTKCHDLNFRNKPDNLTIILSMWHDKDAPLWGNTRKNLPRAWLYDPDCPDPRIPNDAIWCPGNCESCGMCWDLPNIGKDVVLIKHGYGIKNKHKR